jgi:catechol 2,3-dioxygenase-like lactoylglutathione lyase family enzyme
MSGAVRGTSHLIVYTADTDATLSFYGALGGVVEGDEELATPALDAIFGRAGVRIREAFIAIGGSRLHTIETLDVPYSGPERVARAPGFEGISFEVDDIEASREKVAGAGLSPTPVFDFLETRVPCRMFFLADPDGNRVEMIEYV